MYRWKPQQGIGLWLGATLLFITIALAGYLGAPLGRILALPPDTWPIDGSYYQRFLALIGMVAIIGFLVYRIAARLTLAYEIDRNGVYLLWLGNRMVIPIETIERVDMGTSHARLPWGWLQGIGSYWGKGTCHDGKLLHLFSTRSPNASLVIHTADAAYAISPKDQDGFVHDLEQRRRLGAVKPLIAGTQFGTWLSYDFWNDPLVRGTLFLAVILNLIIFGILAVSYPTLPTTIPLHFDRMGNVTEFRPRHQALFLPLAAAGLTVANVGFGLALYRHERVGTYAFQIASAVVQILFGVAVLSVVIS